jgi:hypothetical protein
MPWLSTLGKDHVTKPTTANDGYSFQRKTNKMLYHGKNINLENKL